MVIAVWPDLHAFLQLPIKPSPDVTVHVAPQASLALSWRSPHRNHAKIWNKNVERCKSGGVVRSPPLTQIGKELPLARFTQRRESRRGQDKYHFPMSKAYV